MIPLFRNSIATNDIYYGFPASFRDAIAFRFNAKDTPNFVLREDTGEFFVVSYTDPISEITVSQATASAQPKKITNKCIFDGTNDVLFNNSAFVPNQIKSAVAVANCNRATFYNYDCIVTTRILAFLQNLYIGGTPNTTKLFNANANVSKNVRVNNVSDNNFAPMSNLKSAYVEANSSYVSLFIGADTNVRYWSGEINDAILFNRVLTNTERAELQTYLESFHGFTP
jgi:hypothetical protein